MRVAKQILARVIETEDFSTVQKESHPLNGWVYIAVDTVINAESMANLLNSFAVNAKINNGILFGKNSNGSGFINVFGKTPEDLKAAANTLDARLSINEPAYKPPVPKAVITAPAVNHKPGYRDLIAQIKPIAENRIEKEPVAKKERPKPVKKEPEQSHVAELDHTKKDEILVGKIAREALKHEVKEFDDYKYIRFQLDSSFDRKAAGAAINKVMRKFLSEGNLSYSYSAKTGKLNLSVIMNLL